MSSSRIEVFKVLTAHIKLLRAAYVRWDESEFGAPAIDSKRPYGNSSVLEDIREILGYPTSEEEEILLGQKATEETDGFLLKYHKGTKTAMQIALSVGYFEHGMYGKEEYSKTWKSIPIDQYIKNRRQIDVH